MKHVLITLLALFFVGGFALAQPADQPEQPAPEQPKPEQPKPEPPAPEQPKPEQPKPEQPKTEPAKIDAYFALFTKVGRTWTYRITTTIDKKETVTYSVYEITEANDKSAKVRVIEQDKDRKATSTTDTVIDLPVAAAAGTADSKATEETLKVEAGEFPTLKSTFGDDDEGATYWMSKAWPALTVKSEFHSFLTGNSTIELVAFDAK